MGAVRCAFQHSSGPSVRPSYRILQQVWKLKQTYRTSLFIRPGPSFMRLLPRPWACGVRCTSHTVLSCRRAFCRICHSLLSLFCGLDTLHDLCRSP
ncbi:hypothetical protein ARMSODRAFT_639087 [Armillaria solidipes]|uniref:Uncharacterized protein n=1 Tax=Armillaria solidipes TaxID=1076256 RepID=A0A2H3CBN6_9AGAR|nr:hypothetical protein ARMSODRAFT_639087 [Armillaria solidipes]